LSLRLPKENSQQCWLFSFELSRAPEWAPAGKPYFAALGTGR